MYEKVALNVTNSHQFSLHASGLERLLLDARVIICTLSMMSNPQMPLFETLIPVETVIIDEASQIPLGAYLNFFHTYRQSLSKVVFIGDDKQRMFGSRHSLALS